MNKRRTDPDFDMRESDSSVEKQKENT